MLADTISTVKCIFTIHDKSLFTNSQWEGFVFREIIGGGGFVRLSDKARVKFCIFIWLIQINLILYFFLPSCIIFYYRVVLYFLRFLRLLFSNFWLFLFSKSDFFTILYFRWISVEKIEFYIVGRILSWWERCIFLHI